MLISIGNIIDRSWEHYTKHLPALLSISGWLLIIALVNIVATFLSPSPTLLLNNFASSTLTVWSWIGLIISTLNIIILTPIVSIWVSNMLIQAIHRQDEGQTVSYKEISKKSWHLFFPRLLVGALSGLLIIAPMFLTLPGSLLFLFSGESEVLTAVSTIIIILGLFAGSLLSIVFLFRAFFGGFALVIDNFHGKAAIKESFRLVKGRWFKLLWRLVLPQMVFYIGFFVLQIILMYIIRSVILGIAGMNIELSIRLYSLFQSTIFIILAALFNPLIITAQTIVYKAFRQEGR